MVSGLLREKRLKEMAQSNLFSLQEFEVLHVSQRRQLQLNCPRIKRIPEEKQKNKSSTLYRIRASVRSIGF